MGRVEADVETLAGLRIDWLYWADANVGILPRDADIADLIVAARRVEERGPRLAAGDTDARTMVIRVKGADLADFLARRISREEALQRVEVRLF
mgnify:CR=1 FL=1